MALSCIHRTDPGQRIATAIAADAVLAAMLDVTEPRALTEGWILGLGREADLDC